MKTFVFLTAVLFVSFIFADTPSLSMDSICKSIAANYGDTWRYSGKNEAKEMFCENTVRTNTNSDLSCPKKELIEECVLYIKQKEAEREKRLTK